MNIRGVCGILLCSLIVGSCGQSPSREERALDRMRSRKPPASVRLVNLTKLTVQMWADGIKYPHVKPGGTTAFIPMPTGNHKLKATNGATTLVEESIAVSSKEIASAMLTGSAGKSEFSVVQGEPRQREQGAIQVAGVAVGIDAADKLEIRANGKLVGSSFRSLQPTVLAGLIAGKNDFNLRVGGIGANLSANLEANSDYTLVAYRSGNGIAAVLLRNSGEGPLMIGAAAGG